MNEQLIETLTTLGVEGLNAVYLYLFLEYSFGFTFLALVTWGTRRAWKTFKKHEFGDDA